MVLGLFYAAASVALVGGVWMSLGDPPIALAVAGLVGFVVGGTMIATGAYRDRRRRGRGVMRSFGRAVWEFLSFFP